MKYELFRSYAPGVRAEDCPPIDGRRKRSGLTLEEAQAHCNDPATAGEGWFDGYRLTERRRLQPEGITNMLAGMAGDDWHYNVRNPRW